MADFASPTATAPFDTVKLDVLLEQAGIDVVLVTSRYSTQYFVGDHYPHLFATALTMGLEGYLTIVGYVPGRIDQSFLVGNLMIGDTPEAQREAHPALWVGEQHDDYWSCVEAARAAASLLTARGLAASQIGVELSHIPGSALRALADELPGATIRDASTELEELRVVKTADELVILRDANERVAAAIAETLAGARPGIGKRELVNGITLADARRQLRFHHGLVTVGSSLVRSENDDHWQPGQAMSIDHAADLHGYFGDVTRMACLGLPSAEVETAWKQVNHVQSSLLAAMRAGVTGNDVYFAGDLAQAEMPASAEMFFTCHGIGLNQHEGPRLSEFGFDAGPGAYTDRPLRAGMVVSVETQLTNRTVGMVKIEDSVAVTDTGVELLAAGGSEFTIVEP